SDSLQQKFVLSKVGKYPGSPTSPRKPRKISFSGGFQIFRGKQICRRTGDIDASPLVRNSSCNRNNRSRTGIFIRGIGTTTSGSGQARRCSAQSASRRLPARR